MAYTTEQKQAYDRTRYEQRRAQQQPKPDPADVLTDTEAAYIAGLIDGEGCIHLTTNHICTQLAVQVQMTNRPVLDWLAAKLRTKVSDTRRIETAPHWKPQFAVRVVGKRAVALCKRILPYLIVKAPQAKLALEFGETLGQCFGPGVPLAAEMRERRLALKARMHVLNDDRRLHLTSLPTTQVFATDENNEA